MFRLFLELVISGPILIGSAPGFTDTDLGVLMELEACDVATEIYDGVQS